MNPKSIEIKEQICPHCKKHLLMNIKSFANHVRWCKLNPNRQKILVSTSLKVKNSLKKYHDIHLGDIQTYTMTCERCGKLFDVEERTSKHPERKHYFCSRSCANSHIRTEESKLKTSLRMRTEPIKCTCQNCGTEFETRKRKKYCCKQCAILYRTKIYRSNLTDYNKYRKECQFTFNLSDFPDEFDFELIRVHGMYKAKNRGDNPNGVNRDHMFSILEGYKQHVDPYLISHPANCQLLLHTDNIKKRDKCSISLEQLKIRVREWDTKYQ